LTDIDTSFVGMRFPDLVAEIDKTMITRFAQAIGETDPIHFDEAAAKAAGYPSLPAPMTFPIALKSMAYALPGGDNVLAQLFARMGVDTLNMLHGEQDIRSNRPLCAGETVTIRGVFESIDNKPERNMTVIRETTTLTGADGEVIAEMSAAYVVRHPKLS
jgi:acyl dehydratase